MIEIPLAGTGKAQANEKSLLVLGVSRSSVTWRRRKKGKRIGGPSAALLLHEKRN